MWSFHIVCDWLVSSGLDIHHSILHLYSMSILRPKFPVVSVAVVVRRHLECAPSLFPLTPPFHTMPRPAIPCSVSISRDRLFDRRLPFSLSDALCTAQSAPF